jgi:hypothetical protein
VHGKLVRRAPGIRGLRAHSRRKTFVRFCRH